MHRQIYTLVFLILCTLGAHAQVTYSVNAINDTDDGLCDAVHCSLREAINAANTDAQASTIEFNIAGGGVATIFLTDALPRLTEPGTTIDGMTQNGNVGGLKIDCSGIGVQTQDVLSIFADETQIYGLELFNYTVSENATLEGAGSMIGVGGIFVPASPTDVTIGAPGRGNVIHSIFKTRVSAANFANGIGVHSGGNVIIQGNIIGTDTDQMIVREVWGQGIRIDETQFGSTYIGGDQPGEGNTILGCNRGIGLFGGEGWVKGNRIGFTPNISSGNLNEGIILNLGDIWDIGGNNPQEGNMIEGNLGHGISINTLENCYVGNNVIRNNGAMSNGINIISCPDCIIELNTSNYQLRGIYARDNGNTRVAIRRNTVVGNTQSGVEIFFLDNSTDLLISQNIHLCNGRGILGTVSAPTSPFDLLRTDAFSVAGCSGIATPGATIEVFEHYQDWPDCPGAFCQGAEYMGSTVVDAAGNWEYIGALLPGRIYTCTQTITRRITSPFSACFMIPDCQTLVTNTNDSGPGSFRSAIVCANSRPGPDTITFQIPGLATEHIIIPQSVLPMITDEGLVIDGSTQPNGRVVIEGSAVGPFDSGLSVTVDSFEMYGMTFRLWGLYGVEIGSATNYLNNIVIGDPNRHNEFYDLGTGLGISANARCIIQNNYFGNDVSFTSSTQNSNVGIDMSLNAGAQEIYIGGSRLGNESNYFVNNAISGANIRSVDEIDELFILGNYFGTDDDELIEQPNGSAGSAFHGALTMTLLGGSAVGDGSADRANTFAFNIRPGIYVLFDEHSISGNSFFCNTVGIDLNSNGQNGNGSKMPPQIGLSTQAMIQGTGTSGDRIEVYLHGDSRCQDAECQGKTLLGQVQVDASGDWSISAPFNIALQNQDEITALAIDQEGNTSTFSECKALCPDVTLTAANSGPYCFGDSIFLFGSTTSNNPNISYLWTGPGGYMSLEQNPTNAIQAGQYFFQVNIEGCEYSGSSTLVEIIPNDTVSIDTTLCESEFLMVGSERFDVQRPSGTVTLSNRNNCDSIVEVDLEFDGGFIDRSNPVACPGDTIIFRNKIYDIFRPMGGDTFSTLNGCDSIYSIEIQFLQDTDTLIQGAYCARDTLIINGQVFDRNRSSGSFVIDNKAGCDSNITVDLVFSDLREYNLDTTLCQGDFLVVNGVRYDETRPMGSDTLFGGSLLRCDSVININLQFEEGSVLMIDTTLCEGGSLTFNSITYDEFYPSGNDTLIGANKNGCDSIISVSLSFFEPGFDVDTVHPTCSGGDGAIIINDILGIQAPYKITFNGIGPLDINQLPFTISNLDEGSYIVVVEDGVGCRHSFQAQLTEIEDLDITVESPINIVSGENVNLSFNFSGTPDSVFWLQETDTLCVDCPSVDVAPARNTTYTLWVYVEGCAVSRQIEVLVESDLRFYLPNSFSPDGNNINDWFNGFSASDGVVISQMNIFDRWGELVYSGQDLVPGTDSGWDGTMNGELVPSGVYVYWLEVIFPTGEKEMRRGSLTLIR